MGRRRDRDRAVGGDPPDGLDRAVDAGRALGPIALDHAVDDRALDLGLGHVEVEALAHDPRPGRRVGAHDGRRSSVVHVRPCRRGERRARTSSHQISESTRTPSRSKMTHAIASGRAILRRRRPAPLAVGARRPARALPAGCARRTSVFGGTARRRWRRAAGRRSPRTGRLGEGGDRVGPSSAPLRTWLSTWKRHEPVTALDLDRQLADLDAVPADELAGRPRPFARRR